MPGETIENAYDLENSLRRIARTPVSTQAVPDTASVTRAYAASEAEKATKEQDFANRLAIGEKTLAEKTRQFDVQTVEKTREMNANYKQAVDMMKNWEEQNKWATVLGVLGLGAKGLSLAAQDAQLKKTEAKEAEIVKKHAELREIAKQANVDMKTALENAAAAQNKSPDYILNNPDAEPTAFDVNDTKLYRK